MWTATRLSLRIKIREALPSDKRRVLEFCKDTWPGGDYIQDVWDDWILNRNGRFIVATKGGVPVGIAHASFQTRDVVWLEGLRVHPDCRGLGIAGRLNRALVKTAAQRGASLARLSTAISNKASRRHAEKVGFKLVASFGRFEQKRGLVRNSQLVARPRSYQPGTWTWLESTVDFNRFHSMFSDGWTWYPVTGDSMRQLCKQRRVLVTRRDHTLTSCSIFSSEDRRITLGFSVGTKAGIGEAIRYLRFQLSRQKMEKVRALVPKDTSLIEVLRSNGFERVGTTLVYEKKLVPITGKKLEDSGKGISPPWTLHTVDHGSTRNSNRRNALGSRCRDSRSWEGRCGTAGGRKGLRSNSQPRQDRCSSTPGPQGEPSRPGGRVPLPRASRPGGLGSLEARPEP